MTDPHRFLPDPASLEEMPERAILHWTAGGHRATAEEQHRYHLLLEHVEGDPADPGDDLVRWVQGVPVIRNCRDLAGVPPAHRDPAEGYAAHTRAFNGHSIGMALCGMRGAVDRRPGGGVDPGTSPISRVQVRALIHAAAAACVVYGWEPVEDRVFTHFEAEFLHGVDQLPEGPTIWKWNVTWVPGLDLEREDAGPWIREQVARVLDGKPLQEEIESPPRGETAGAAVDGMVG